MLKLKTAELQIGDTVQMDGGESPFNTCIVKQIKDGRVTFFRPYGHFDNFQYTSGIICYVGIEEYQVDINDSRPTWRLLERKYIR